MKRRTVLLTEKDAVKLPPSCVPPGQTVWVVALDFQLPEALRAAVLDNLHRLRRRAPTP